MHQEYIKCLQFWENEINMIQFSFSISKMTTTAFICCQFSKLQWFFIIEKTNNKYKKYYYCDLYVIFFFFWDIYLFFFKKRKDCFNLILWNLLSYCKSKLYIKWYFVFFFISWVFFFKCKSYNTEGGFPEK